MCVLGKHFTSFANTLDDMEANEVFVSFVIAQAV